MNSRNNPTPAPYNMLAMDFLSEVLESVRLRCVVHSRNEFTAPWGFYFPAELKGIPNASRIPGPNESVPQGLGGSFYLITQGQCWLEVDDAGAPIQLGPGDLVVLTESRSHTLRDSPDSPVRPLWEILKPEHIQQRGGARYGGGGALTTFICGPFFSDDREHDRLFPALPPCIHLPRGAPGSPGWLPDLTRILIAETESFGPGSQGIIDHLAQVLFIQAIRHYVAALQPDGRDAPGNWLRAMFDPDIGQTLAKIHATPEVPWTVASLAQSVAMSRSAFAARFAELVGQPPLHYLTDYRMRKAAELLRNGRAAIKEIAGVVGYDSEAAFSHAFKRVFGVAPGAHRKQQIRTPV
jgi:AraC-like DNA-binding protein